MERRELGLESSDVGVSEDVVRMVRHGCPPALRGAGPYG